MKGFYGRILVVDVSDQTFEVETMDDALQKKFLGGKGLALHLSR